MNGIYRLGRYLGIALLIVALAVPALAQDATAEPMGQGAEATSEAGMTRPIVCESSLILLVGLAQRDFGFQSSQDMNQFERGQYGPLFEDQSDMGDTGQTGVATGSATGEATPVVEATESMGSGTAGSHGHMGGMDVIMLQPPVIVGEVTECTQLRTELERFFSDRMAQGSLGGAAGSAASG